MGRKVPLLDDGSRLGADISSSTSNSGRLLSGVTQDTLSSAFFFFVFATTVACRDSLLRNAVPDDSSDIALSRFQ